MEDVVRALGHLALGTRMKRIGERLQADTQALIAASDIGVPVVQWTVLAALDRLGPSSVGELAAALGVRQPGITRTVSKMEDGGLVEAVAAGEDRRIKRIGLTHGGEALVERARHDLWPRIEAAVASACADLSGPLLDQLTGLEEALAEASLGQREHVLDRPVWSALTTRQTSLAEGDEHAWRFLRDVNVFASARNDDPTALAALVNLVGRSPIYVLQRPEIVVPPGLVVIEEAEGVQMVATRRMTAEARGEPPLLLGDVDAPEMLALATLTEPGPFLPRTHVMGPFRGVRQDGALVAMAGERLRVPGYTEVSGVCTHPSARGQGRARYLSAVVSEAIFERGEIPFLHSWASNHAAIALYQQLGFVVRCRMNVRVLARAPMT